MLTCLFSSGDLLRTRFAISPLREMIGSVEALSNPASASIHVPWIRAVRPRLAGLDLAPLAALPRPPGSYQPDFIAPPPQTPLPDVHEEIERIRQTPPEQLRWELHEAYPDGRLPPALGPLLSRPRTAAGAIADLVAAYWERALEPYWEAIRHTLEDDIAHRARLLTTSGQAKIFDDLHPDVRWRDGHLEIERPTYEQTVDLAGRGMMLIPSAFIWPHTGAVWDPPWQPGLIYPARGIGNLWAPARPDPQALADLLGARRATILASLDREASTTTIARRLKTSAASISEHLGVLRRSGLVRARRQGREVLYTRTPAANILLQAAP